MQRLPVIAGLVMLCLAMLVGVGATQDTKKEKDEKKDAKFTPQLPAGFKKLGLSKDQVAKIYEIQSAYHAKIAELQTKLNDLKDQRTKEEFKILTADQREKYLKSKGVETKPKEEKK